METMRNSVSRLIAFAFMPLVLCAVVMPARVAYADESDDQGEIVVEDLEAAADGEPEAAADGEFEEAQEDIILEEGYYDYEDLANMGYNSWTGVLEDGKSKKFHLNDSDDADAYWSVGIATFELTHRSRVDLITIYQPEYRDNGTLTITVTESSGKYSGEIVRQLSSTNKTRLTSGINDKKTGADSIPAGKYRVKYVYRNAHDWDGKVDLEIGFVIRPLFNDVPKNHWAASVIADAVDKQYLHGYNSSLFGTKDPITRGQVATVLWNMAGKRSGGSTNPFSDVPSDKYYTTAIKWVYREGIVRGYPDGTFKPDKPISRQELAVMLYNFAVKYKGASSKGDNPSSYVSMSDKDEVATFAEKAMGWCFARKVLTGGADSKIYPTKNATRAEAAKMFVKVGQITKL